MYQWEPPWAKFWKYNEFCDRCRPSLILDLSIGGKNQTPLWRVLPRPITVENVRQLRKNVKIHLDIASYLNCCISRSKLLLMTSPSHCCQHLTSNIPTYRHCQSVTPATTNHIHYKVNPSQFYAQSYPNMAFCTHSQVYFTSNYQLTAPNPRLNFQHLSEANFRKKTTKIHQVAKKHQTKWP